MDIEWLSLLATTCIVPIIGIFTGIFLGVVNGWVNHNFDRALERYKKQIQGQSVSAQQAPAPTSQAGAGTAPLTMPWPVKVFMRGGMAATYLFIWLMATVLTFSAIRPFGTKFVLNRIYELQAIPFIQEILVEVSQIVALETMAGTYVFMCAALVGLLAMTIFQGIVGMILWILDVSL